MRSGAGGRIDVEKQDDVQVAVVKKFELVDGVTDPVLGLVPSCRIASSLAFATSLKPLRHIDISCPHKFIRMYGIRAPP